MAATSTTCPNGTRHPDYLSACNSRARLAAYECSACHGWHLRGEDTDPLQPLYDLAREHGMDVITTIRTSLIASRRLRVAGSEESFVGVEVAVADPRSGRNMHGRGQSVREAVAAVLPVVRDEVAKRAVGGPA